uniref:Uncharacterized protein n=1 Tax=Rhizophora mucronata TaxID=61149 RepID=A0A2P2N4Q0_RHIMU
MLSWTFKLYLGPSIVLHYSYFSMSLPFKHAYTILIYLCGMRSGGE